ncbi:MAG: amino acid adenylation domain-containing protein [Lachnospiraceae bacterium]|nr:amino acid adenylation domain-containing protein [Lachnospiraceae bacterium]
MNCRHIAHISGRWKNKGKVTAAKESWDAEYDDIGMAIKGQKIRALNLSQREIAMAQQVRPQSARNTISLKLHLPNCTQQMVKEAADRVLDSADIFALSLQRDGQEWRMVYGEQKLHACNVWEACTMEQAEDQMTSLDRMPMDMEKQLYNAVVIPLLEGGVYLYVCFHHVIIDGYGMSLFVQKILDALSGKEIEESVFAETAQDSEAFTDDFWRHYFADVDFEPSIFPEIKAETDFDSITRQIPDELMREIEAFSHRENVSVPYIVASAYSAYLAQASGKPDAVFLMPRLNRMPEQMNTLGCYTLLVPVRVRTADAEAGSFAELCRLAKQASQEASAHKGVGFDQILSVLREDGIISNILSEYVFNFYRFQYHTDLDYNVRFSVAGDMTNHMTFSLFYDKNGGLTMRFDYHKSVYTKVRAQHFSDAICEILCQGVQENTLSQTIGKAEYQKVTSIRGKRIVIEDNLTIPSLFRQASERYTDRPAVYAGNDVLTFAELDLLSDQIACALILRGVKPGDYVAFMLKRDIRLIPTIIGIAKSGAAFIPIDPAYPSDRISYIMENSCASCLISSPEVPISRGCDYVDVDELMRQPVEDRLLPEIRQEQPAYMIYTSGTTGRPKGVMLSHKGIANIVHTDNNPFNRDITQNCHGIVAIGSICFDISLFELFVPLMNGLFVELGSEKAMVDAGELAASIQRHGADVLHCTPPRITAYQANDSFAEAFKNVKAVLAAGEVLPGSLVKRLHNTYGIRIYNGYGPTETTIGATITEAGDDLSIGRPIANTGVVLLNGALQPVPYGAVGEICVYGNGVGIGYHARPEETAAKYIVWNGMRLYRTGDFGYFLEDGRLIYRGRNDGQVKLRGLRIELSEIENVMGTFPGVMACSCIVRKIDKTDHLVGFYTVSEREPVDAEKLRVHMKSRLTSYMVPDILKELAAMPQTPNGKTDQKALAAEPVEYQRMYREPVTSREKLICSAFEKTLELPQVGLDDNFFELGGDSLSAVTLVLCVEKTLQLEKDQIEFGDVYQYPTPALLLERLYKETKSDKEYDISILDYRGFSEYLIENTGNKADSRYLGNVLLTGATGYLGVHILIDLLRRPKLCGKIICLARPKKSLSAEKRVMSALFYYAEEDFSQSYGEKWEVVEGDITQPDLFLKEHADSHGNADTAERADPIGRIDTIINSAANVAHFSYGDTLETINTEGVKNLIRFALRQNALLCQISTISVAGITEKSAAQESFSESDFYIGQEIHNKYIYSKYLAEYELLRAAVDKGLQVKLMRVGNLQGRISDGEFQMNMHSNAFTRQFAAYVKIGAVPQSVYDARVNFSPVDETAHNIVSLTSIPKAAAFHVYPPNEVRYADLFLGMERLGYKIDVLSDEKFDELLQKLKQTDEGREQMEGLFTKESMGTYREIPVRQQYTNQYLQELSEGWSTVTEEYINKYLSAMDGMGNF